MNKVKRLEALLLAAIMMLSLGVSASAKDDLSQNYEGLFSLIGHTDGAGSEDLSYDLYQAFEANPDEFISAAASLSNDEMKAMVELLVYFAGYIDLDDFRDKVVSCENTNLNAAEKGVVDEILYEIDAQMNETVSVEPAEELPEVPKYNPYFLEKLVSSHVASNNFEDEEFFETLSNVYIADPATFSAVLEDAPATAQDALISGVAQACVRTGNILSRESMGQLTAGQERIISEVEEKILAVNVAEGAAEAEKANQIGDGVAPMSTQVPTIGTMTYEGDLICGEATTLTVKFTESTATTSARTYWTEVYAVRNGREHLKSSKSITIAKGATSTTQSYSITYSDTGEVYTLVKVYSSNGGSLLTQRQGKYSDIITGPWAIIVDLPQNRNYKGSLSLYHANGALQKTCECLGLAESNGPMTQSEGNTPTGTYRGELYPKHPTNEYSYGPYRRINMVGVSGIAKTSGRTEIMIHGGAPATNTSLPGYPLRCTHGCIRVTNDNQKALVDLVDTLIANFYADEYGDVIVSEY